MGFYKEYWAEFLDAMKLKTDFPLSLKKTVGDKNWLHWECFGRKGFKLIVSLDQNDNWICVNFGIDRNDQKHNFADLKAKRDQIDKVFGSKLRWEPKGNERSSTQAILTEYGKDVQNRAKWPEQHEWMLDHLQKMFIAFKPQVDCLVTE